MMQFVGSPALYFWHRGIVVIPQFAFSRFTFEPYRSYKAGLRHSNSLPETVTSEFPIPCSKAAENREAVPKGRVYLRHVYEKRIATAQPEGRNNLSPGRKYLRENSNWKLTVG
jgi:hypothetical protein